MPTAVMERPDPLIGKADPRVGTEPLRPLTRATSKGFSVCDFAAEVLGEPLLKWQRQAVIRALELNPDGTYRFRTVLILVARQNGKTHLLKVLALWRLYVDGARLVLGSAQNLQIARESWLGAIEFAKAAPALAAEVAHVRMDNNSPGLHLTSGARYLLSATTRGAGRGLSVDLLILDELREQRDWTAWSSLSKTTMARTLGQVWAISNAGDDDSVVLNALHDAALSGRDDSICLLDWSAPAGCDLDDTEAWCQANPGLGTTVSEAAIRSALGTDPPNVFRCEVLCQRVDALDSAVDGTAWKSGADAQGSLRPHRDRLAAAFDVSPDGTHASLVIAAELPDGRVRVEVAAAWRSTETARMELPVLLDKLKPAAVAWFPGGPANAFAPMLKSRDGSVELTGTQVTAACMGLADLVAARRVLHPGDPLLDAQLAGTSKLPQGDGFRFTRRGVGHCDAAYAAAGAIHAALTLPAPTPKYLGRRVV